MNQDVSTNISLTFTIQPKRGETLTKLQADGVTVGTVNVVVDNKTFKANEYLEYTTKPEDFDYAGLWRMKGEVEITSTNKLINDYALFTVLD